MSNIPPNTSQWRKRLAQVYKFLHEIVLRLIVQLIIDIIFRSF